MKNDFEETTFHADTSFDKLGRKDIDFAERRESKLRKSKRRGQQLLGILMLMLGYMSLAVTADTDTMWLLFRVVAGFALLFVGFALAIGPIIASIFRNRD